MTSPTRMCARHFSLWRSRGHSPEVRDSTRAPQRGHSLSSCIEGTPPIIASRSPSSNLQSLSPQKSAFNDRGAPVFSPSKDSSEAGLTQTRFSPLELVESSSARLALLTLSLRESCTLVDGPDAAPSPDTIRTSNRSGKTSRVRSDDEAPCTTF